MTYSMTGFAQAEGKYNDKEISVDVRSLNSKFLDLRVKLPLLYKNKEHEIRKIIQSKLRRGKVEISITLNGSMESEDYKINQELFTKFFHQLSELKEQLGIESADIMQSILRIPNVIDIQDVKLSDDEWQAVLEIIEKSLDNLSENRRLEGKVLEEEIKMRVEKISSLLSEVIPLEEKRIAGIKSRITKDLEEISNYHPIDKNRFEQEVIYYLDKLDITEEKVRLKQHCIYFQEVLQEDEVEKGKKLAFISQEIGREINTLGAKAQSSDIQKIVVQMKNELEKIKEQLANVQ